MHIAPAAIDDVGLPPCGVAQGVVWMVLAGLVTGSVGRFDRCRS